VLGNLIDNALEATRLHTGEGGRVQLSMTDLGNELIFEVEDQGPGISEEAQQKIFERGVSTKQGEEHGIGLHLVRQFLNRWGGSVTVENRPEGGSRFTLYLPKTPEARTPEKRNAP
jgi:two-component system CitB family sensor kinase